MLVLKGDKKAIVGPITNTIVETPPIKTVVGFVGHFENRGGLAALTTVSYRAVHLDMTRSFFKNFYKAKKKVFTKHSAKYEKGEMNAHIESAKRHCSAIRITVHTQMDKVKQLGRKRAHRRAK